MKKFWMEVLPPFLRQKLEGRPYLQNVVSNTGWLFAEKMVRMGVGLFVGVWVARFLGPEQFGYLSYALAFVSLFSAIAGLGLDGIVVRDLVRDPSDKDKILGTAFVLKFLSGVFTFLIVLAAIRLLRPTDSLTFWLVGIIAGGMIFNAFDTIDFWFQSQVQSKFSVVAKSSAFLLISVAKVALILTNGPLIAFAGAGFAEIMIGSMGMVITYRVSAGHIRRWRTNLSVAKRLLKDSWPLILSSLAIMIYMRIDQVMIGEMIGSREVGIYSVAVQLVEAWYFLPGIVVSSVFPSIVEAKEMGEEIFYERLQYLYNFMAFMAYVIAIPVTLGSVWVINILYGSAYSEAGPMLAILIWSILFTNLGVARSTFLTTMNWTKVHFLTVGLGCVVNVILNCFLIPLYGGLGAVIASCVAYWFAAHGACFMYRPLYKTGFMLTKAMFYPKIWW
jgi:O-antigen/teichoic acid export membrane protein